MRKSQKVFNVVVRGVAMLIVFSIFLTACSSNDKISEYHLSHKICRTLFGVDPKTFCERKGQNTWIENGYTSAALDKEGNLVLKLSYDQVDSLKNARPTLQILQKIIGEKKRVVSTVIPIPSSDPFYGSYYQDAGTCGFDISDDYTKIIAGPEDNISYKEIVLSACFLMQVFSGKPSDDILVEYVEVNKFGNVIDRSYSPMYMYIFEDISDCEGLKQYANIGDIMEYYDVNIDTDFNEFSYEAFWGMKYSSSKFDYEIFAYVFTDIETAITYYVNASGQDDKLNNIPVDDSVKISYGVKIFKDNEYKIVVIDGNRVYKLVSKKGLYFEIDQMLKTVFSVKV